MIIFNKEKYEGIATEDNAGIVGENLVSKVEFTVNDFVGKNTIAAIHLRFKDGSVNTVAPQTVKTVNNSTYITSGDEGEIKGQKQPDNRAQHRQRR